MAQIRNRKARNFGTIKEKEKHHISMLNNALNKVLWCKFCVTEKYFLSNENRVVSLAPTFIHKFQIIPGQTSTDHVKKIFFF